MDIFFIEENLKANIFKKIFKRVEFSNNRITINMNVHKVKINKRIKTAKKVLKILNNHKCKKVIISKDLKKNDEFVNAIYSSNIKIIDGRTLFKMYILDIVDLLVKQLNKDKRECKIAILSNDYNQFTERVIKELALQCKFINVITYNIQKFETLEEKLKEEGVIISISNNKRRSLLKSEIILNLDFPNDVLNKYSIFDKALIVNFEDKIKINKKRFSGRIFNGYELKFIVGATLKEKIKKEDIEKFYLNELIEYYYYLGYLNLNEIYLNKIIKDTN